MRDQILARYYWWKTPGAVVAAEDCRRALSTRDRNCVCRAGPSRKAPGMWLATLETPGFRMPRMVMHWSDASIGRATPRGRSFALTRTSLIIYIMVIKGEKTIRLLSSRACTAVMSSDGPHPGGWQTSEGLQFCKGTVANDDTAHSPSTVITLPDGHNCLCLHGWP